MVRQGEQIKIKATVLRVEGTRVDAQTADGSLIQTHVSNVEEKQINLPDHKAIVHAPENKSVYRKKNR